MKSFRNELDNLVDNYSGVWKRFNSPYINTHYSISAIPKFIVE